MNELDELIEIAAHIETLRMLVLPMVARAEQRDQARLRQARKRTNAPTTHESAATRERRSA